MGTQTNELRESWLIQRLSQPRGGGLVGELAESLSFGGGLRNGGLSAEAMAVLRQLFSFDYMGAAEFEFGALAEAFGRMAKADLGAYIVNAGTPVYVLCARAQAEAVVERLTDWLTGTRPRLKESTYLEAAVAGEDWCSTVGWFELDNGFMFFTDHAMWERTCEAFGVPR